LADSGPISSGQTASAFFAGLERPASESGMTSYPSEGV
jgi:hypothetical protein